MNHECSQVGDCIDGVPSMPCTESYSAPIMYILQRVERKSIPRDKQSHFQELNTGLYGQLIQFFRLNALEPFQVGALVYDERFQIEAVQQI